MNGTLQGVGVALITPFLSDHTIDFSALSALVERVIEGGADYLVVLGTTAESATLSPIEKGAVVDCVIEANEGRLPLVIGIGGNNTAEVVAQIEEFDFKPFCALLSVTPYYNKPSQEGLYEHYRAVAEASPVPVILYNVPGRTGVNLTADTTLRIAHEIPNVAAIKEASGDLSQAGYILRDRPKGFLVISGDDNLTMPLVAMGGDGVISVAANAYTRTFSDMVHATQQGEVAQAAQLHLRMMECTDALFAEGNPVGVKAALAHYGVCETAVRLPLMAASEALRERMAALISQNQLQ